MPVQRLARIPQQDAASWQDAYLPLAQAQALLAQPGHVLYHLPQAYLLVRLPPGAPVDILTLHTHPAHRRQGYASRLLEALRHDAAGTPILLDVRVSNAPAIALYRKLGFQILASRKNYYSHPAEDALVLQYHP